MNKIKSAMLVLLLLVGNTVSFGETFQVTKADARNVINRTAAIVTTAQRFASQGSKYDGLGLAVAHQLTGCDLYYKSSYSYAAYHSLRARTLAARVITLNKKSIIGDALYDRIEEKLLQNAPSGQELDKRLTKTVLDDQEAAAEGSNMGVD